MVSRNMYTGFSGARSVAYVDDGYIKGKLSVTLQVFAELKRVLKEDTGLELHDDKTCAPQGCLPTDCL